MPFVNGNLLAGGIDSLGSIPGLLKSLKIPSQSLSLNPILIFFISCRLLDSLASWSLWWTPPSTWPTIWTATTTIGTTTTTRTTTTTPTSTLPTSTPCRWTWTWRWHQEEAWTREALPEIGRTWAANIKKTAAPETRKVHYSAYSNCPFIL